MKMFMMINLELMELKRRREKGENSQGELGEAKFDWLIMFDDSYTHPDN